MKRMLSRTLFNLTIRTPFMAFFLFIVMIVIVFSITYNSKIDVYVDKTGIIQEMEGHTSMIQVQLSNQEYAEIDASHEVKWYFNRNNQIYSTSIYDVQKDNIDHVVVMLAIKNDLVKMNRDKEVQVEFYSRKERVLNSLIRR